MRSIPGASPGDPLTPTELLVLRHLATGQSNEQIGVRMDGRTGEAVKSHVRRILVKLRVETRTEAASLWLLTMAAPQDRNWVVERLAAWQTQRRQQDGAA